MRRSPCTRLKPRALGLIPADDEFVPHPRRATAGAQRAVPCQLEGMLQGGRRIPNGYAGCRVPAPGE
jgi:hypothetical protein